MPNNLCIKNLLKQALILSYYIELYFDYRKESFPSLNERPKQPYISHYPDMIRKFSPLKHLWTITFEQKHKYFKTVSRRANNFKYVIKTLTENHQLLQASLFEAQYNFLIVANDATNFARDVFHVSILESFIFVFKKIYFLNATH